MNAHGRSLDKTFLHLGTNTNLRGYIHRDYLAHCLRWSHVAKYLAQHKRYQTAHVLDVGCGQETPLPRLLYSMRLTHTTGSYTGVDAGTIKYPETIPQNNKKFKLVLIKNTDFVTAKLPRKAYNLVISFEVLEHVEPLHSFRILDRLREIVTKDGLIMISTPCYDPRVGAADNHVNEMSYVGLRALIGAAGLKIKNVWGTFASQRDYVHLLSERFGSGLAEAFDQLAAYYDSTIVSCMFAPLFPAAARNCLWELQPDNLRSQIPMNVYDECHSSSTLWQTHLKQIAKEIKR